MKDDMQGAGVSRRHFLALLTHGGWMAALGVSLYQIGRFLGAEGLPNTPSLLVEAGKLADFPPGSATYVAAARAWLRNDAGYLTALDAVCPHLGCLVQQKATAVAGFQCPCHGSHFGAAGELQQGPAERPLRTLAVQTRPDDTVIILIAD